MGVTIKDFDIQPIVKHNTTFPYWALMHEDYYIQKQEVKLWCKDMCQGRYLNKKYGYRWSGIQVVWFFTVEDDAALFKLTWG